MSDALDRLSASLASGGTALLPTDTVYGLAAALESEVGVDALYRLKDRPRSQPCQVLLLGDAPREAALEALSDHERRAAGALLPGPSTCIVADPAGTYARAAGEAVGSVGLRAPAMDGELAGLRLPLVATSANEPGGPDPATVDAVPARLRAAVSEVWDAGRLPGIASAVVDLRPLAEGAPARLVRDGPDPAAVRAVLAGVGVALV